MSKDLEILDADIAERQARLRELHAIKRRILAQDRKESVEQSAREANSQGLELAIVQEVGSPNYALDSASGFPTAPEQVDMSRSQPALVDTSLGSVQEPEVQEIQEIREVPEMEGPKVGSRDHMFMKGALSGSSSDRGPMLVTLFSDK